jgi:hypothetical protein
MPDLDPALTLRDQEAGITGIHPLAALFPPLNAEELSALMMDVRCNGIRTPMGLVIVGIETSADERGPCTVADRTRRGWPQAATRDWCTSGP